MSTIKVLVQEQSLRVINGPKIASRGVNENVVEFVFDESWNGFGKTAMFYKEFHESNVYQSIVDSNGIANVPHEVTDTECKMCFGVVGIKDNIIYTSEIIKYNIVKGVPISGSESEPPSPTIYQQMLSLVGQIQNNVASFESNIASFESNTNDRLDAMSSQMDEFIAEHAGTYGETVLWDSDNASGETISGNTRTVTLAENCSGYDYIDVHFGGYVRTNTGVDFVNHYQTFFEPDYNNKELNLYKWQFVPASENNPDGIHFKIIYNNKSWLWNGNAANGAEELTVSRNGWPFDKIVGRKLVGDAELIDARVGVDGTVYQTVGAAIRGQVNDIAGGAVELDTTLTQQGKAAEAKAVGDALALKADKSTTYTKTEVDTLIDEVEVETDTTLEIAGAPADAKKVGDELSDIKADLGDLSQLETSAKENLVDAINEANANGGSDVSVVDGKLIIDGVEYDITSEDAVGISNIAKTGTSGLVDTYTITMTDGTTYTFTVTNGDADDTKINQYIEDWLDDHPEATTTVQDGAITTSKLSEEVKSQLGTRPNHNYLYNSTQQEGTSTFVELFQKVKNEVMDEYRGNIDKIPFILITDPHGQLSGRKSIFQAISSVVNWYDVSKFFNLGDVVTSTYGSYTNSTDELTTNGQLETMISVLSPIPMDKQVNVFGNHDSWCSKNGETGYKMLPQNLLAPYFRNAQGHRMSNAGYFALKDDYFNVKYVVVSGFEYVGGVGVNAGTESASTEQISWLIKELGTDDGYDIVVVCHEPLFPDWAGRSFESQLPPGDNSVNNSNRWAWLNTDDIFLSRKNKTSGSFTDRSGVVHTYDFSGMVGNLLCGIDGHLHYDCSQYTGNDEFLCESFGSFKPDQGGFLYFGLIDRENGRLNIWKVQYGNLYYENYQVPFAIPSTAGTFAIKRRLKHTKTYQISRVIREGQSFFDIVSPSSSSYTVGYVKVLMGGVDVTSTYYDSSTGAIFIPSVTGDIEIIAYDTTSSSSDAVYIVTNDLENATTNKPTVYSDEYYEKPICVNSGSSFSESINSVAGYIIYDISVMMGSADITSNLTSNRATVSLSVSNVTDDINVVCKACEYTYVQGLLTTTGSVDSSQTSWGTTSFIPIDSSTIGSITCDPSTTGTVSYVAFYDEDYSFLCRVYSSTRSTVIYVPSDAKYMRVSMGYSTSYKIFVALPNKTITNVSVTATATGTGLTLGEYPVSIRTGDSVTIPITISEDGDVVIDTCTSGGINIGYVLTENSIIIPYTKGDVVVSAHLKKTVLYRLSEETTLTNTSIDTGIKIVDTYDDSFTVMLDFTIIGTQANNASIASTADGTNYGWYIRRQLQIAYIEGKYAGVSFTDGTETRHALSLGTRCKIVLTHVGGNDSYVATLKAISYGDESPHVLTATNGGGSTSSRRIDNGNLILGSSKATVTFHNVLVLSRVATDSETNAFLTFE